MNAKILVLMAVIAWLFMAMIVMIHEDTHKTIFEYFGCQNATANVDFRYMSGYSECNDDVFVWSDNLRLAHSIVEIQNTTNLLMVAQILALVGIMITLRGG